MLIEKFLGDYIDKINEIINEVDKGILEGETSAVEDSSLLQVLYNVKEMLEKIK